MENCETQLLVYQSVARKGGGNWECAPCEQKLLCSAVTEDCPLIYANFFFNDKGERIIYRLLVEMETRTMRMKIHMEMFQKIKSTNCIGLSYSLSGVFEIQLRGNILW